MKTINLLLKTKAVPFIGVACVVGVLLGHGGCASIQNQRRASVVAFLYPNKAEPIEKPSIPTLSLPMDVGLAFVPEDEASRYSRVPFTEKQKIALLREIGSQFKQYPFVRSIQLIPTQYLRPGGSFANLEQIRTMFGTDTIALLSYDQVQFTDPGMQQLLYWTPMGSYLFKGEWNDTSTLIDAAVYHIPSRTMLFRAPGTSQIKRNAAIAYQEAELRADSDKAFRDASTNLVTNLQEELQVFKEKIKTSPQEYKVEAKRGYDLKAVGKLDGRWLLVLAVIVGVTLCPQPRGRR
jgi:rhombotail lipoprotein